MRYLPRAIMKQTGRPKSVDRHVIEILLETMHPIQVRDAAKDGLLAISLERVRGILKEIRRTERKKIKKIRDKKED